MNKVSKKTRINPFLIFFTLMFAYIHQVEAIPFGGVNIIETHQGNFTVGQEEVFTVVVSVPSIGDVSVTGLTVTDVLPTGFSFVGLSGNNWSASIVDSIVTLTYSEPLAAGESTTVYLKAIASRAGVYTNTVAAFGFIEETLLSTATAVDTVIVADYSVLSLSMTHKKQFVVDHQGIFNIYVGNNGSEDIKGPITVINTLPNDMKFIQGSGNGWVISQTGQTIVMEYLSTLAAGEVAPAIKLKVKPKAVGIFTNSAVVTTQSMMNVASDTVKVVKKHFSLKS